MTAILDDEETFTMTVSKKEWALIYLAFDNEMARCREEGFIGLSKKLEKICDRFEKAVTKKMLFKNKCPRCQEFLPPNPGDEADYKDRTFKCKCKKEYKWLYQQGTWSRCNYVGE